jgi:hypothetical protein
LAVTLSYEISRPLAGFFGHGPRLTASMAEKAGTGRVGGIKPEANAFSQGQG